MRILEFIFKMLWQFLQFEPGRFSELKDKAFKWQQEQDELGKTNPKWYHKWFKYDQEWWFQVLLCIVFLVMFKQIRAWLLEDPLAPGKDEDEDQDDWDDEDGHDDVRSKKSKISLTSFKF
jgi:hypothetical protein